MNQFYIQYGKRLLDLILMLVILVVFLWLLLIVIFCYCLTWKFPILFRQLRMGRGGVPFEMWKLRTLSRNEQESLQNRRFKMGDFLRATNLDELPQLWNVLKGEMSLIGPRPLPMEYSSLFSAVQKRRFQVRPGVTGWAQVNGRHSISWQKKFELDNYYVDNLSFRLDTIILIKTIVLLLSFRKDDSLHEEKFKGN